MWHLYGITHTEPADPEFEVNLAHVVSVNLTASINASYGDGWTKQPFGLGSIWPETHLWAPYILNHNGTYYMFYCGGGVLDASYRISLATSQGSLLRKKGVH